MGFQKRKFHSYKKSIQEKKLDIKVKKAPKCDIHSAAPGMISLHGPKSTVGSAVVGEAVVG